MASRHVFTAAPAAAAGWLGARPDQALLMGPEDPSWQDATVLSTAADPTPPSLPSSCGPMAHVPLPIMPRREQVNGGGPTAASLVFLGEQSAIATRLSGSSNMAPALRHMGWLASLCACVCLSVWVYMCVCVYVGVYGGCQP